VVVVPAFDAARPIGESRKVRSRVHLAWGLTGTGVATAITAGLLTLKGRSDYNKVVDSSDCVKVTGGFTCNAAGNAAIADAQRLANVGTVLVAGSALLVGAAAIVYLTAPRETVIAPVATEHALGIAVVRTF
jgi:sugar (pentulose or hexulose) kinase